MRMVVDVIPGSPAAKAGIAAGMRLVAVNGRKWSPDILREAIRGARDSREPIALLVENEDYYQTLKWIITAGRDIHIWRRRWEGGCILGNCEGEGSCY